jgi:phytoene dehydrogenase-like protein
MSYDAIVIGGGVNGLTCAALLGKAGLRVALVEQRDGLGGCALERQIAPGFRAPTLAHRSGPLRRDVVEGLQLAQHGLRFSARGVRVTGLAQDGRALTIHADPAKTSASVRPWSARDAEAWPAFAKSLAHLADVVATLFERTPPDVDAPGRDDLWTLMRTIGAFRGLDKPDAWRLLRWGPMAVADLVSEHFETELLRATVAADGLLGGMLGPWSAGSGLQLLLHAANESLAAARHAEVIGGPAAAADALAAAARRHGVDVRTGSAVGRIDVTDDRAIGVSLANGDELRARAVVSGVDPRRTFLTLCDADHLPPEFLWRIGNLRARGTLAKVNLALSSLPEVPGVTRHALGSPVRIGPDLDYLERAYDHAKYGRMSTAPWIEFTVPSVFDAALAPDGAHVLSAYVQYMPFNLRAAGSTAQQDVKRSLSPAEWDNHRDALGTLVVNVLAAHASGLEKLVVGREVITPLDLERDWGLTGGHIFHGDLTLDQAFTMRPLLGWGRYRTPIRGLYLCGSGTHPGTGLTGGSGANAAREVVRDLH